MQGSKALKEGGLFFRQWLRSPKSMGSMIPSSRALGRAMAGAVVRRPGQFVVELGGGTGAISKGLIEVGIPRDKLLVIELDGELAQFLKQELDGVRVVQGDATRLDEILERLGIEDVGTVISGLPMVGMPLEFKRAIVERSFEAMGDDGVLIQYTYAPVPSIPPRTFGLRAQMVAYVFRNIPPASVWRYTRDVADRTGRRMERAA